MQTLPMLLAHSTAIYLRPTCGFIFVLVSYVLNGGGICMELLTPTEWSPATSVNALVMSIRAMLVRQRDRFFQLCENKIPTSCFLLDGMDLLKD